MTTIAYRDGVLATDTQEVSLSGVIVSHNVNKLMRYEKETGDVSYYGFSGFVSEINKAIAEIKSLGDDARADFDNMSILKVTKYSNGEIRVYEAHDNLYFSEVFDEFIAIGSGSRFALVAMDLGEGAISAVKCAMKRDTATGGYVRHVNVNQLTLMIKEYVDG